ncbi:uncharacterized protein [Aristolochia californica]
MLSSASTSGLFCARAVHPYDRFINLDKTNSINLSVSFLDPLGTMVLTSCNGLLLCARESNGFIREFYVCDPTSQDFVTVPTPQNFVCEAYDMCTALVIFPSYNGWTTFSVNGLHKNTPTFQIISFNLDCSGEELYRYSFKVYSSKTQEWKPVKKTSIELYARRGTRHHGGVYNQRAVHWMAKSDMDSYILSFNLSTQTARKMLVPGFEGKKCTDWFGECNGFLYIVRVVDAKLEIWKLEDYLNDIWVRNHCSVFPCKFRPVGFDGNRVVFTPSSSDRVVLFSYKKEPPTFDIVNEDEEEPMTEESRPTRQPWFVPYTLGTDQQMDDEWIMVREPHYCD